MLLDSIFAARDRRIEKKIRREIEVMLSHELKTPLTSILGYSEILMDNLDGSDRENYLHASQINRKSKELVRFIDNMITVSVLEFNPRVYYQSMIDLNAPLLDAVNEFRRGLTPVKKVDLSMELEPNVHVMANERLLRKCIMELLLNACQYTAEGSTPFISISLSTSSDYAVLAIKDKGIGIPASMKERVGDRFFRVENADTAHTSGLGLGLFLVKRTMELFSGTFHLESRKEQGTQVSLFLPLCSDRAGTL